MLLPLRFLLTEGSFPCLQHFNGFARDSNIKITDVNGQLIYETTSLGGQAIWDGRDYNGRKASTGVYLVLATRTSNRDTPEAVVTKILFIN